MKCVFLFAYDKQNLGDDLFIHTISRRYSNVQFYMWSERKNKETFYGLPNLKVIDKDSFFVKLLYRIRPSLVSRYKGWLEKRCDAVVFIGGSIFIEYENWEQILTWWEYEAENRPFYILGANFGPYKSEGFREKLAEIFAKCRDVCFRDRYSYQLFKDVPTVRYAPDILFSYPMPEGAVKEKQVFVSLIDCVARGEGESSLAAYDESYVHFVSELLKRYLNDGYSLILASFCKEEGDENAIRKVLCEMNMPESASIRTLCYNGTNTDELTAAIAESECVIATRFHATILALAAGRPVLPIVYSDKTLHVLEDLGFEGTVYDLRKDDNWGCGMSRCNGNRNVGSIGNDTKLAAQRHFERLDKKLN